MSGDNVTQEQAPASNKLLALGALGVVFGDIGTSPLYTLKTVLFLSGDSPTPAVILGLLSLIFWTLVIVTSIKYALFAMKMDNSGEGGILALMSLLVDKKKCRPWVIFAGLFGAALIYGDGAITPAISVLSALEGMNMILPESKPYIVPATVVILVLLFGFQSVGTGRIGKLFGPIMALWFIVIGALGIWGIVQHPAVLLALNPVYGIHFLFSHGFSSFLVLGGVFLCVTGAEALYADMGHFGRRPIWIAWFGLAFPSLLLNYAGQAALILSGADVTQNIFYRLCPTPLLIPLVILATVATIIASQAIISGAFSMTRQAIQLGWLPRLRIKQTSAESYGQIYIGVINWLLMIATLFLTVTFESSDRLAAAYGIAVSFTMVMTTGLLFVSMREIWRWGLPASLLAAGIFMVVDMSFLIANMVKILEGGYIPILLALVIYAVMTVWHRGVETASRIIHEKTVPINDYMAEIERNKIPRVPGTAVFLTRSTGTPTVMRWHVTRNGSLHEQVVTLNIHINNIPRVASGDRLEIREIAPNFWHIIAHYGFIEQPDISNLFAYQGIQKLGLDNENMTFYVGHETIVKREGKGRLPVWQRLIFSMMVRNSVHVTDHYHLPSDRVVEISRQVAV
ncbi:potassium transporter Kup [Rouxiella silvae]|uniref:Low affinity potassium transport system protein Kup n=1 Tax=Rouxiella silvae TaxID=1646373 RepID=A0ABX3U426_9GAMM|nr:KUP/HAK/KT family potassium transporter [Rouxiella silvae]ORJ22063.1 potassium transporter Kup [Rouxiella silvae]